MTSLNKSEDRALKRFKSAIENALRDNLIEIKLFGSRARGDARADSDIDVLIITKSSEWRVNDVIYAIATDILLDDGVAISPKVLSEMDYRRLIKTGAAFAANVAKEGVPL